MSHDLEAAYAASELAGIITTNPVPFFGGLGATGTWNVRAGREAGHNWPLTDGILLANNTTPAVKDIQIAFEYKRTNEGLHGILTALGQCFSYLEKGYDASVMVIPEKYASHADPGGHINQVIKSTAPDVPIWLYTYDTPNMSVTRPFGGKMRCVRSIDLPSCRAITRSSTKKLSGGITTLWAHMREGMSHPDALFRYCQAIKIVTALGEDFSKVTIPTDLISAIGRIKSSADVYKYLSNTSGDSIADKAWRYVWFNYYFWNDLMPIFSSGAPTYTINNTNTKIRIDSTNYESFLNKRNDSIKKTLVDKLNAGTITESAAWEVYAKKVRSNAHSYREVIDSGLYHIGFVDSDGTLTELGYRYVDQCERTMEPYAGIPMEMLRAAFVQNGQYGALLHYIYKLSEDKFSTNFYEFCKTDASGNYVFDPDPYMEWINDEFVNNLHILKQSTARAGRTRKPLQAEIAFLKKLGFVKSKGTRTAYRIGVGLEIDWPQVENSMLYAQTL